MSSRSGVLPSNERPAPPEATRSSQLFRAIDVGEEGTVLATFSDEVQRVDETTGEWLRGRSSVAAFVHGVLPRVTDLRSELRDIAVRRWGDIEIETFVLRQHFVLDGTPHDVVAPVTMVWRHEDDGWKLVLAHEVARQ